MKENVKNVSEEQGHMGLNTVNSKKVTSLQIIYVTFDFNCLKMCELNNKSGEKESEIIKHLRHQNIILCRSLPFNSKRNW